VGARKPGSPGGGAVLFDSDVLIWYLRGEERAREFLEAIPFRRRLLSSIVVMELMRGCRDRIELRRLHHFFDGAFGGLVHVSEEISRRAIGLVDRHSLSHRIAPDDALIAATALTVKAELATANVADYRFVSGLALLRFRPT
jgi:predicted nucleic acid-binding protein